jgi:hypothetical protein
MKKFTISGILFFILFILNSSSMVYGQDASCQELFNNGKALMNKHEWAKAIGVFEAAKSCDSKLTKNANTEINICRKKMNTDNSTNKTNLLISKQNVNFNANGGNEDINISGGSWSYTCDSQWVNINREANGLKISCLANNSRTNRIATITINSKKRNTYIQINQMGSNPYILSSRSYLSFRAEGSQDYIEVTSNVTWSYYGIPDWCTVTQKNNILTIIASKNYTSNEREGSVILSAEGAEDRTIKLFQSKTYTSDVIYDNKQYGDNDFAVGIIMGINMGHFSSSASSDFIGSVVNYGYGNEQEKPNYKTKIGFNIGILAELKIAKHSFIQSGLYFTSIKSKNNFSGEYTDRINEGSTYLTGQAYDKFEENYSMNYFEIPLLYSHHIVLSNKSMISLQGGTYFGYAISGKMKLNGSTDWPDLTEYYTSNNTTTGNTYYINENITGEQDLFDRNGNVHQQYTTGSESTYNNNYKFASSPFKRFNMGLRFGIGFEYSKFLFNLSYDIGLVNIANKEYWEDSRLPISEYGGSQTIKGYSHHINCFSINLGYIFR